MNPALWHGRRVFLTGHTGFKGSWLSLWLQELGAEVCGYALAPPTNTNLFTLAHVERGMRSQIADVRDLAALQKAMHQAQPEIVFHLAAQPLVRASYDDPVATYATNVMGTVHLLEAVRQAGGVKAVVNVTTDKCYENREWNWGYRESDALGGYDPYSNSKGASELVTAAYRNSFFNPAQYTSHGVALATARAGNVIGGGDWAVDRLVPDMLDALQSGTPARIRNPHAIRPWQHVLEPLRGYLTLAERLLQDGPDFGEAWNFGPLDEDAKPVSWIAAELTRLWGHEASWAADICEHPHEAHYLKLDISKARARLPWTPLLRLSDALRLTVDWARQQQAGDDMHAATLSQIRSYQTLAITS
ncbi:MAG: CDP-glucose 4,6-dehydratase [Rhodoferax sp.]|nr:CDP-glucose 4,6-dehydratase [Rhodoferax sp.]